MARQKPEQKVQNKIIKFLKDKDIYYEKRQAGGFTYRSGLPDVWFIYKGKHVEVEVKSATGGRSPLQIKWGDYFIQHNTLYTYVNSFEEFLEFFATL